MLFASKTGVSSMGKSKTPQKGASMLSNTPKVSKREPSRL
jgi:hypothetical protein